MSLTASTTARQPDPRPTETDEVTVVVATRNRLARLHETVPQHRAPVIVVDNGSDEPVDPPGVETVALGANLGAAARNVGGTSAAIR